MNVLRALIHTNYRHFKEHITVYKQFIKPILTYAHIVWQSLLKNANLNKLQTTQNAHGYRLHQNKTDRSCPSRNKKSLNYRPNGHERHTLIDFLHKTTTPTTPSHPRPPAKQKQVENPRPLLFILLQHSSPRTPKHITTNTHTHTHFANRSKTDTKNRYNIQSLEHLRTHTVEVCNFLQDGGVIQSTRTSPPHTITQPWKMGQGRNAFENRGSSLCRRRCSPRRHAGDNFLLLLWIVCLLQS